MGDQKMNDAARAPTSSLYATSKPIEDLSVAELKRQHEEIQQRLVAKEKAERQSVIDQIVAVVREYHITTEEIIDALGGFKPKRKGIKAKIKYRDPVTGVTWSGRGKEPTWLRGNDRNRFLIPDGS
jgi:DNA-binding protein H-NS